MSDTPSSSKLKDAVSRRMKARKVLAILSEYRSQWSHVGCLELGCASGLMSEEFAKQFGRVVGLDVNAEAIAATRSRPVPANVSYLLGDATRLPFDDESFDLVVCAQVYEHVGDSLSLMREIYRVLRNRGVCFFSGPNRLWPIEDHYGLPFLHWLPRAAAGWLLRLTGRGRFYAESPQTSRVLRRQMVGFDILDFSARLLSEPDRYLGSGLGPIKRLPGAVAEVLAPFVPNFNWVLEKHVGTKT